MSDMSFADQNNPLLDAVRKGRLGPEQQQQLDAYLAAHPAERPGWDEELALNHLLDQVPEVPVSSNFTALLLERVQRENSSPQAKGWPGMGWIRGWIPKLAAAAVVVCVGLLSYEQHQAAARRELARQVSEMARLTRSTPLEVLENFEAIQRLNHVSHDRDRELIAALQ